MGRALGYDGKTCKAAIREVVAGRTPVSFSELEDELSGRGAWSKDNIAQDVIAAIVNLPPARRRYKAEPFLFLRPDGQLELFDPLIHPRPIA